MPKFTKKHYIVIASIMLNCLPCNDGSNTDEEVFLHKYICDNFKDYFIKDNPKFDEDKFLIACGIEE